jgi:hypothetical protein
MHLIKISFCHYNAHHKLKGINRNLCYKNNRKMETTFQSTIVTSHISRIERPSIIAKFMTWCKGQEKNRLGWLGGILTIHGCVLTPITLFAIILSGTYFPFYIAALVAMGIAVVTNLAAMPTKITIPLFFFSVIIDLAIIISCISMGFNLGATQI